MAKRRKDCSLNDYVLDHLKKKKHEKTLKCFGERTRDSKGDYSQTCERFTNYLMEKEIEKENEIDDLGFEINFEAYQTDIKLPKSSSRKSHGKERKTENVQIHQKETKMDIPKDFIKKIVKFGLKEEDAQILFESKINWTAVYFSAKLYCTEQTCDFFTKIDNEEMTKHMIKVHKYGEYACEDPYCNYVGFSKKNLNIHRRIHTRRAHQNFLHKCLKPNCVSSFPFAQLLDRHMRLHNNDLDMCQFCPYRYEKPSHYKSHLKKHFGTEDFACDHCDKKFPTITQLNHHHELHEGIIYCCKICDAYQGKQKSQIVYHLKQKHADVLKDQTSWKELEHFTQIK